VLDQPLNLASMNALIEDKAFQLNIKIRHGLGFIDLLFRPSRDQSNEDNFVAEKMFDAMKQMDNESKKTTSIIHVLPIKSMAALENFYEQERIDQVQDKNSISSSSSTSTSSTLTSSTASSSTSTSSSSSSNSFSSSPSSGTSFLDSMLPVFNKSNSQEKPNNFQEEPNDDDSQAAKAARKSYNRRSIIVLVACSFFMAWSSLRIVQEELARQKQRVEDMKTMPKTNPSTSPASSSRLKLSDTQEQDSEITTSSTTISYDGIKEDNEKGYPSGRY